MRKEEKSHAASENKRASDEICASSATRAAHTQPQLRCTAFSSGEFCACAFEDIYDLRLAAYRFARAALDAGARIGLALKINGRSFRIRVTTRIEISARGERERKGNEPEGRKRVAPNFRDVAREREMRIVRFRTIE